MPSPGPEKYEGGGGSTGGEVNGSGDNSGPTRGDGDSPDYGTKAGNGQGGKQSEVKPAKANERTERVGESKSRADGKLRLGDPIDFGSSDFIFNEFVSDFLGPEVFSDTGDWCGSSPDDFVPELFPESCFNHDKNYSNLSFTKDEADTKFLFDMTQERPDRIGVARVYYEAVQKYGGGPYEQAQENSRSNQARRTRAYGRGGKGPLREH